VGRSLFFGFTHVVFAGVSIAAGIAISGAGMWLTYQYFQGGIELSSQYHFAYNLIVFTVILFYIIVEHFKPSEKSNI